MNPFRFVGVTIRCLFYQSWKSGQSNHFLYKSYLCGSK